jgi:LuxR family maltose regulon positive regulatory protein
MSESEFTLKTTSPRLPRSSLHRDRLSELWSALRDQTAISVVAPKGFGKTTLLLQWRRSWLEQGAFVAWLSADAQDEPARFTRALLHAIRGATGRSSFDVLAARHAAQADREIDALTALLSEIAGLGVETVIMLDDTERLPEATIRQSLAYLILNAPANLHVLIGSRVPLALPTHEMIAKGSLAVVNVDDLRLRLEESTAILVGRFGQRISLDDCARLHDATEGWPIGLQLAAATIERSPDLSAAIRSLSGRHGDIESYFIESLVSCLPVPVADFLTRISILERMSVELCEAVTGSPMAAAYLDQLVHDTPIVIVAEQQDWMRLHPLARDFLLSRFEQLPLFDQEIFHCRAFYWFARQERFHEAACHALAARDEPAAQSHAVRALWTLGTQGKLVEARAWLDRIPAGIIARDPELHLIAAWIMALGDRNEEALAIAKRAIADPAATPRIVMIATRVAGGAAAYSDRIGLLPEVLARGLALPAVADEPLFQVALANGMAMLALQAGDTERARWLCAKLPGLSNSDSLALALALNRTLIGVSHLWDGNAYRAEAALRPALIEAERSTGRRGTVAGLYAAVLAATLLERDQPAAAQALLAYRLDVIERVGFPDVILCAHRTLAYVAMGEGDERRALDILDNLHALAESRRLPRLTMHCLAEQVRIHSLQGRNETVGHLILRLEFLEPRFGEHDYLPFQMQYRLVVAIARSYAALGRGELDAAEQALTAADALAAKTHRGRDALTVKVLRAVVGWRKGAAGALPLLSEALGLAAIGGNRRLLADTHPLAVRMAAELELLPRASGGQRRDPLDEARLFPAPPARAAPVASGLLTPKEAKILGLLSDGMSNKLIARAMEISDETVKWHLKNLFSKLSAGNRKHAVGRARLLGLIDA